MKVRLRIFILLADIAKLVPLTLHLVIQVVATVTELFVSHPGHLGRLVAGRLPGTEPREHLHQGEIRYLLSGQDLHRFQEETDLQFRVRIGSGLRDFLQRCLIQGEVSVDLRIDTLRQLQIKY